MEDDICEYVRDSREKEKGIEEEAFDLSVCEVEPYKKQQSFFEAIGM